MPNQTTSQPLTEEQLHLVSFIHQQYALTGKILSAEEAQTTYAVPISLYTESLNNPTFLDALSERGINLDRSDLTPAEDAKFKKFALSPLQLVVANSVLDMTDTRTIKKKLQDLGVSTAQYQTWLKDQIFLNYLQKRAEQGLDEFKHEADLALMDRVRLGDTKAIAYYNEMIGRFTPQRGSSGSNVDVQNLLVKIIEIINDEITDYDTALKIANRLRSLAAARNTAAALVGEESIVVPQIAPTRSELETAQLVSSTEEVEDIAI